MTDAPVRSPDRGHPTTTSRDGAAGRPRRVSVLVVSGDPGEAAAAAERAFPGAAVAVGALEEIRSAGARGGLSRLRRERPDVLAFYGAGLSSRPERPLHVLAAAAAGASLICLLEPDGRQVSGAVSRASARAGARVLLELPAAALVLPLLNGSLRALTTRERRRDARRLARGAAERGPLSIAYLRSEPPEVTGIGGTTSHTVGWVRALADLGHSVHVVSTPPAPEFDHAGVRTTIVPHARTRFGLMPFRDIEGHLRFTRAALALLRASPPDFVMGRHRRFDPSAALAAIAVRRPLALQHEGSEEVVADHYEPTRARRTLRVFERFNHAVAGAILAVSEEVVRDVTENRGVAPGRAVVAHSGVDTRRFRPGAGGEERREELGLEPDRVVVGFCGTFGPWHGVELLVEAVAGLETDASVTCLLVGDGDIRPALQRQADESRAPHEFRFTGLVPLADMPSYLDACDVLACPTRLVPGQEEFFGSPTKLFEYMAAGKAVVASAVGQIPHVIRDGENGLLVPESDVEALRAAIGRLLADSALRERLGSGARETVVAQGGWERNARLTIEQLEGPGRP